jgi:hypothetical protein
MTATGMRPVTMDLRLPRTELDEGGLVSQIYDAMLDHLEFFR